MTIQVDNNPLPPAVPAAAARAADALPNVDPATRVTVEHSALPRFDVIAEPVAGRLDLVGEFDLACGQRFRAARAAILAGGPAEVVVDLTRLRFIDASGIGLLVELGNELAMREATLHIVSRGARIGRVFSICGLAAMLTAPPVAP